MSLATTRSKRANAGSKMSQVLDKEEDDFYKQAYGGFHEEENDNEYEPEEVEGPEDVVDSDFDLDEQEESVVQDNDEKAIEQKNSEKEEKTPPKM